MSRIGDLTVRVGADISDLRRGLDGATGRVQGFRRSIAPIIKTMAAVGAAATAAAVGVAALTKSGMDAIDAQAKLARQLDSTIGGLRGLQLASEDAGVATGVINSAMERFSARLGEAQRGTGQAKDALDRLGLSARALASMDVDERMAAIADRVQQLGLSGAQTADILRQFGIRNREIVNLLRQGGDAIRDARGEIEEYGLAISDIDAAAVERANDAFARSGLVIESVQTLLAVEFADTITAVSRHLQTSFLQSSGDMRDGIQAAVDAAVDGFADVLDGAASLIGFVTNNPLLSQFGVLGFVLFGPKGAAIGSAIGATFDLVEENMNRLGVGMTDAQKEARTVAGNLETIAELESTIGEIQGEIISGDKSRQGELNQLIALHEAENERIEDQLAAIEGNNEAAAQLKGIMEGNAEGVDTLKASLRGIADVLRGSRDGEGDEGEGGDSGSSRIEPPQIAGFGGLNLGEDYAEQLQKRLDLLRDSLATEREIEMERYQQANEDLKESLELKLITKEQYDELEFENHQSHLERIAELDKQDAAQRKRLQEQQARDQEKREQDVANYIIGTREDIMRRSAQLLDMFAGESKAAAIASIAINKALSIAQATQNTAVAYTKALTIDPTGALAARVAKLGATQVGVIAATGVAQAAGVLSGGASGGGGSTASAGSAGGGTSGGQPAQPATPSGGTLTVQGISSSALFTGDAVRELAQELIEYQKRGGQVVIQ